MTLKIEHNWANLSSINPLRQVVTFVVFELKWTGGYKMSTDGKSNSDGNILLKGASSEAHSIWMSMENLRIRDDTEGHNKGYQLGSSNGNVLTPDARANNLDVLCDVQLRICENVGAIQDEVYNMGTVPFIDEKTKKQVKLTKKGKEYKMAWLEKKRLKLV